MLCLKSFFSRFVLIENGRVGMKDHVFAILYGNEGVIEIVMVMLNWWIDISSLAYV